MSWWYLSTYCTLTLALYTESWSRTDMFYNVVENVSTVVLFLF